MRYLVLLFVVVPLGELYLLLALGGLIGFWPTVGITLMTAIAGSALAKREGLRVWRAWQEALSRAETPSEGVLDGLLVLVGGTLLITPGIVTDVAGFLLLIPWSRRWIADQVRRQIDARIATGSIGVVTMAGDDVRGGFDAEAFRAAPAPRVDRGAVVETSGESLD